MTAAWITAIAILAVGVTGYWLADRTRPSGNHHAIPGTRHAPRWQRARDLALGVIEWGRATLAATISWGRRRRPAPAATVTFPFPASNVRIVPPTAHEDRAPVAALPPATFTAMRVYAAAFVREASLRAELRATSPWQDDTHAFSRWALQDALAGAA